MQLRLRRDQTCYIVDTEAGTVYENLRGPNQISREDSPDPLVCEEVLRSAREYAEHYARAIPGTCTIDGLFEVRGPVTQSEQAELADGGDIAAERAALELHLDYFDLDLDGWITLGENYRGWRGLGFGRFASAWKAFFSAFFFGGLRHGLAIELRPIGRRYRSSGIFDGEGKLQRMLLGKYLERFDDKGRLTFDETTKLVDELAKRGFVSRRQFESLYAVCRRMNAGMKVVTKEQFKGLFDGSLLWRAASMTDPAGRRARWLQPAAHLR